MDAVPWPDLALGGTVLLAAGALASVAIRSPHERHRTGAATVLALLCWLGLALAPLPRFETRDRPAAPTSAPTIAPVPAAHRPVSAALPTVEPAPPVEPDVHAAAAPAPPIPVSTRPATAASIDVAGLLRDAWIAGALAVLLLLGMGHASLRRMLGRAAPADPALTELARSLWTGASPAPAVLVSGDATRPFCCGVLRPVVVVPRALCAPRLHAGLAQVLRHEFAHVRRGDLRVQALFALALVPFWWHPLLWWLRARTRFAAELVADEIAAAPGRHAYARDLLEVASTAPHAARSTLPALSVFERESDFSRRMKMLLARHQSLTVQSRAPVRALRAIAALSAVFVAAGLFGQPALHAQNPIQEVKEANDLLAKLRATKLPRRLESWNVGEAIEFFARRSGINFVLSDAIRDLESEQMPAVDSDGGDASIADALDAIAKKLDIRWRVRDGAVVLSAQSDSDAELERIIRKLRDYRAERARDADQPAATVDFDLLCRMLGDTGESLRAAVGAPGPGKAEAVVTDMITLLRKDNEQLKKRVAQLEKASSAIAPSSGQDADGHDLGAIADLATRAIDARGEVQTAEAALARLEPLAKAAVVERSEVDGARVHLQLAKEKLSALHTLVKSEREALSIELNALKIELDALAPEAHQRRTRLEVRLRRLLGYVQVLERAL